MEFYEIKQVEPWLYSIFDPLGAICYLAVGEKGALLYDTGFGIGDLAGAVRRITDKPLTVVLGHAHIDHANGAYQFESAYLDDRELGLFAIHTSPDYRANCCNSLRESGIDAPPGFDPDVFRNAGGDAGKGAGADKLLSLKPGMIFDLGGLSCEVVDMAGHTAGSDGLLFKDKKTLLVSDAANGHSWMFLDESLPISEYVKMLDRVYELDFDIFYTGHDKELRRKDMFKAYKKVALEATIEKSVPYERFPELQPYFYEDKEIGVGIVIRADKLK